MPGDPFYVCYHVASTCRPRRQGFAQPSRSASPTLCELQRRGQSLGHAKEIVLKAQILAGGRGKGVFSSGLKGGVHLTKDPKVVGQLAKQMIGYNLTTKQTPKEGVKVNKLMVAEALNISRETYFAILMDRSCNGPVLVGSPQGGMDIEEVAASSPELIFKEQIDIMEGIKDSQAQRMAENLGFLGPLKNQAADEIKKLYHLFLKIDATQVEVNPFGETPEGQVVCFDAKINFDDNAEFRQKDIFAMDDGSENEPIENEAAKYDLKYIGLDGNIACFVNGAGLAMATCDIIFLNGGKPANFLDLGGGVQEAQVYQAFKLLTADPKRQRRQDRYRPDRGPRRWGTRSTALKSAE
ncbi:Succinyl-CoA ligase [GDP-forming] subunit beta, mitochondrial [Myotis brandtii]|uniref:succinate--CoA ligase (GDP-forming) n=1 Tax=Myotis brandtii TaxID=109478 RepID=S7ML81_MYOBR|nr:Succinyl-CoA ligase [GDP-forming] subunit beta, mitochondrial [Myotis brandtii]